MVPGSAPAMGPDPAEPSTPIEASPIAPSALVAPSSPIAPERPIDPDANAIGTDRATTPVRLGATGTGSAARAAAATRSAKISPTTTTTASSAPTAAARARTLDPPKPAGTVITRGGGSRCRPPTRRGEPTPRGPSPRMATSGGAASGAPEGAAYLDQPGGGTGTQPLRAAGVEPARSSNATARADRAWSSSSVRAMPGRYAARSPSREPPAFACGQWDERQHPCGQPGPPGPTPGAPTTAAGR